MYFMDPVHISPAPFVYFQIMVQSLGFLRSCALFYHYLSSVAAPVELTGGPLPPDQEFIQLTRYLSLPTTPRHLLNSDFSLALGRHQDHRNRYTRVL
jgi:hypothetical protein